MTAQTLCPCGRGEVYGACCGRFHAGDPAPTAELLMRSRFSAFAVGDVPYLRRTWHPSTRPRHVQLDADRTWTRLDILDVQRGGLLDTDGVVEFRAHSSGGVLHERSRFVRADRAWLYLDGVLTPG
ncbi:YchJ family protein [Pseudonocardia pini]|uniref:YchJ family protein n=1 Tax=Pseudonocardia pini TaxID=2758030 RepID=UPI0028AC3CA9|nr:YchJ family metal-binding protein [Pseudonocardia pini]